MKMLLVSPKAKADESMKNNFGFRVAQMSLAQVATLLPPDVEVEIADEVIQDIPFDTDADLIGITVMTEVVERAYEIAGEFRLREKPIIMGGIHPSLCPDEAKKHCDSVVIGEAEGQMHGLIDDFRNGRLKPFYRRKTLADPSEIPVPKRDILNRQKYLTVNCVQISRGCPNRCSFCIVPTIHGRRHRLRPIDEVIAEIEGLKGPEIFFFDDNLAGNPKYARELFTRMIPLRKRFIGQLSFSTLKNDELLGLIRKAGGVGFFIGFESLSQNGLESVGKKQKVSEYHDGIKRMQGHGLAIVGAFIFGLDSDDTDVFKRTVEFIDESGIDIVQFTLLVPFPGTPLYKTLEKQNRLVVPKWWLDSSWNLVPFYPAKMNRQDLRDGWVWALKETYRLPKVVKRIVRQVPKRPAFTSGLSTWVNFSYRSGLSDFSSIFKSDS